MKKSAGILAWRKRNETLEVLLVHPGGPFFKNKDLGAWSIPKGEYEEEDPFLCAQREFTEETGQRAEGDFKELSPVRLKSGKEISAWAVESDIDLKNFSSNTFKLEWPAGSGKFREFPEADKAEWMTIPVAAVRINPGQVPLLEELLRIVSK